MAVGAVNTTRIYAAGFSHVGLNLLANENVKEEGGLAHAVHGTELQQIGFLYRTIKKI